MTEGKSMTDYMKSLPAATDTAGKSVVLTDSAGAMSKMLTSTLLNVDIISKTTGAYFASAPGIWLIVVYSKSDVRKYVIGFFISKDTNNNESIVFVPLVVSEMTYVFNNQGSIQAIGVDDAVYLGIRFKTDMI